MPLISMTVLFFVLTLAIFTGNAMTLLLREALRNAAGATLARQAAIALSALVAIEAIILMIALLVTPVSQFLVTVAAGSGPITVGYQSETPRLPERRDPHSL